MKEVTLPWGDEILSIKVPSLWEMVYPQEAANLSKDKKSELRIVSDALKRPSSSLPLEEMKLGGKKIVIITDDNTRPTPVARFLHLILAALKTGGALMKNIIIIPGLGIHTPMTGEEMALKAGVSNLKNIKWENHYAFDRDRNHFFGNTSHGTPVWLNSHIADAGLIILLGMTEPHIFAGFGGGMKNILPGIAYADTIGIHHAIIAEPPYLFNRVGMMPEKNSFRLDLEEVRNMIPAPVFCVNVVLSHNGKIKAAFAGDPVSSHREAIIYNIKESGLILKQPVDGIIVNSNPMNINFKQGMKCVGNSLPALKPGGSVMAFIRAERGIDDIDLPEGSKPLWLVKGILRTIGPSRVMTFLEKVRKGMNVEDRFQLYYSLQLMRQYNLYFYIPPVVSKEEIKRLGFFRHSYNPQDVIDMAARKMKKKATVAVFPNGGATFPVFEN